MEVLAWEVVHHHQLTTTFEVEKVDQEVFQRGMMVTGFGRGKVKRAFATSEACQPSVAAYNAVADSASHQKKKLLLLLLLQPPLSAYHIYFAHFCLFHLYNPTIYLLLLICRFPCTVYLTRERVQQTIIFII